MKIPFLDKLRRRDVVGLDLGHSQARFIQIREGGQIAIWNYPISLLEESEREGANFREFLKVNHLMGASVVVNIDDPSLRIRKIDLPKMPESDLRQAVRWQLRDAVDGPLEDFSVSHSTIEEYRSGEVSRLSLIVYAIRKKAVQSLSSLLKDFGLSPVAVEPQAVSLAAALERVHGFQPGEYYGLIDLGETRSLFTAMGEGRLLFSRPLPGISGRELTAFLKKEMNLGDRGAEDLKRALVGVPGGRPISGSEREKAESLLPSFHTRVAIEGQRSADAFTLMFRREKINHLFLCGGGARLAGLEVHLAKNLAIPTSVLDPSAVFRLEPESAHLYNVALGLALFEA